MLFNHCSFQKPDPFSLGFWWFSGKKDPWKEWSWKQPLDFCVRFGAYLPSAAKAGLRPHLQHMEDVEWLRDLGR